jgi:hypothetical protein
MENSGNELKKYLKTKEEGSKTKLKRTQIECTMRALNAKFVALNEHERLKRRPSEAAEEPRCVSS